MKSWSANRVTIRTLTLVTAAIVSVAGCGANTPSDPAQALFQKAGCSSCHGAAGEGRVGPKLVGLYGSTVTVTDREGNEQHVTADGAYLRESIVDPGAKKVAGYRLPMPTAKLSHDQVTQLVAYIESLSSLPPDVTAPATTNAAG